MTEKSRISQHTSAHVSAFQLCDQSVAYRAPIQLCDRPVGRLFAVSKQKFKQQNTYFPLTLLTAAAKSIGAPQQIPPRAMRISCEWFTMKK